MFCKKILYLNFTFIFKKYNENVLIYIIMKI